MRTAVKICVAVGLASAVATLIGYAMETDPDCWDPPCGGAKWTLIIYGTVCTIAAIVAALLVGLSWALTGLTRRD